MGAFLLTLLFAGGRAYAEETTSGGAANSKWEFDFTWNTSAVLGYRITPLVSAWGGYRALGVDYDEGKINGKKKLLQPGFADGDYQGKVRGDGWGYRLATLLELNESHQLGLMYRSPIEQTYRGKIYMESKNRFKYFIDKKFE